MFSCFNLLTSACRSGFLRFAGTTCTARLCIRGLFSFVNRVIVLCVRLAWTRTCHAGCFVGFLIHIFELTKFLLISRPFIYCLRVSSLPFRFFPVRLLSLLRADFFSREYFALTPDACSLLSLHILVRIDPS